MAEVKVLVEGVHKSIYGDKLKIGSTTTLIKSDKNIIVDPGYPADADSILEKLKQEGLTAEGIDLVVITHLHFDHAANVHLFSKAKLICKLRRNYPGQIHSLAEGYLERFDLVDGTEIAKDVSILTTPGHTGDMISLVIKTDNGLVVIAGDAVSEEKFSDPTVRPDQMMVDSMEDFDASREKILKIADYIIPGHGKMFQVEK